MCMALGKKLDHEEDKSFLTFGWYKTNQFKSGKVNFEQND